MPFSTYFSPHGFELVQSIFPGWKFSAPGIVAACGLHGALLIGARHPIAADAEAWSRTLSTFEIDLKRDGAIVDHGRATNVLGGPVSALRHLVDILARFAGRLHGDLQEVGVRCWLDAKEIKVGDSISEQISRAVQAHDKVLLVLSRSSVRSSWVQAEIRKAFDLERARQSTVLFPIRLDDAVFVTQAKAEFERLNDRLIIDFSGWQDRGHYQRAFSRLVRDLAITASVESEGRE